MNIKLTLLIVLALNGNLAYAMRDGYIGFTPQEFVGMHTHEQRAEEKNQAVLKHISAMEKEKQKKERMFLLPEFNPSSTDVMCTMCQNTQTDETNKLPWTKLLNCKHEFHIQCISQFGAEAQEAIAKKCPNCQQNYTLAKEIKPFFIP